MLAQLYKWAAIVFAVLAVALLLWCIFLRASASNSDLRAAAANQRAHVLEAQVLRADEIIREERERADRMAGIAEQTEKDMQHAKSLADSTTADLLADNRRLRSLWAGHAATDAVSATAAGTARADADDRLRAESAGRIIGAVAQCQAQRDGLQAVVRADRK